MYNDIESLNGTIEHLKYENAKQKTAMLALGAKGDDDKNHKTLQMDEIDDLQEKINELDGKLKEREQDTEELKRLDAVERENCDLKTQIELLEENVKNIGLDDEILLNEKKEVQRLMDLKEQDYRRITESYDDLHKKLTSSEEERETVKLDRDRMATSILDQQRTHENEICNLKGTLDYLAEKMSILSQERESKEVLREMEDRHREETFQLERIQEDMRAKCERYDFERNEQTQKVADFVIVFGIKNIDE